MEPQCVEALWEGDFRGLEPGPDDFADADITQSSLSDNHRNVILTQPRKGQEVWIRKVGGGIITLRRSKMFATVGYTGQGRNPHLEL